MRIRRDRPLTMIAEKNTRAKEGVLDIHQYGKTDLRIERRIHLPRDFRHRIERRTARIALAFDRDVVIEIRHSNDARIDMDVVALAVEREATAVHALMMLHRCKAHALRQSRHIVEDMGTIHRMLDVVLVVLALKGFYILFEKPLIKTRLADIVEEARENNILCCLTVKLHPLGNDPREDRHAQRVVIDVAREMIDLIEVINRSAAARERQQILLHHLIRLFHGNSARLLCLLKDRLRRPDDILILLDEEIAAREDRRTLLLQLRFVLDVDNGDLQKLQARDMRLRQLRILRHHHHALGVDDRPR